MEDNVLGAFVMVISVVALVLYGFFIFFSEFWFVIVKWTAFLAVAGVLMIVAWIGYTLLNTPGLEADLEVEE